jgi:hypothetical protein
MMALAPRGLHFELAGEDLAHPTLSCADVGEGDSPRAIIRKAAATADGPKS